MNNDMPDLGNLNSESSSGNKPLDSSHKNVVVLVYVLQAISLIIGFTAFIALIINYVKKEDVEGTVAESHFRWQIRTFWFGLLWMIVGLVTYLIIVGYYVLFAATLWYIYRIVKGWLRISENRPMYQ